MPLQYVRYWIEPRLSRAGGKKTKGSGFNFPEKKKTAGRIRTYSAADMAIDQLAADLNDFGFILNISKTTGEAY